MNLELEKIKQSTIYLTAKINKLYFTKFLKLMYYFDFLSILERGKPVTNDIYYKLPFGPVPTFIKEQMNLLSKKGKEQEKELFSATDSKLFKSIFDDVIDLSHDTTTKGFLIKAKAESDYGYLSDYEKGLLDDISNEFKNKTATDLVKKTHQEPPYIQTPPNNIIDYKLAFYLEIKDILPKRKYAFNIEVSQMRYMER